MRDLRTILLSSFLVANVVGCAPPEEDDPIDEVGISDGKADGETLSACEAGAILQLVNDKATTIDSLRGMGLTKTAATNIVKRRDQSPIPTIALLDKVPNVGKSTFTKLAAAVKAGCAAGTPTEVIFSPAPSWSESHLARLVGLINDSKHSIDIAIYSFRDAQVLAALQKAVVRGVDVRFIYNDAGDHQKSPSGTTSAALEAAGVDVRFVNKIMHHKIAIFDGPRESVDQAKTAVVMTGSANWSSSAATNYDENTIVLRGQVEATLRTQREFNTLWENSRDFTTGTAKPPSQSLAITDVQDGPGLDIVYTSDNFTPRIVGGQPSFTLQRGKNTVADRLVSLIMNAKTSIHLASTHLRESEVADALVAKRKADPQVDIKVYLDGQEYLSSWGQDGQDEELAACIEAAGASQTKKDDCYESGLLYSLTLHRAGIDTRLKYYAYRWDASYATQMHNKYVIVDGKILASGSYNLSNNAEHETMENMVIYDTAAYQPVIDQFEASFAKLWQTGRAEGRLQALESKIASDKTFPVVFDPIALDPDEIAALKDKILAACPAIDDAKAFGLKRDCTR